MKKFLPILLAIFLANGFSSSTVFAERTYSATGTVDSIDREFAKIKVGGRSYRLSRTVSVHDRNRRGELEPIVNIGDSVGLVFVSSQSSKSSVQEIWLLSEGKK